MAEHRLNKDQKTFDFDAEHPPVLEIDPGDTVTFETGDVAYERLYRGETVDEIGLENFNAVTGPVFVRGAEPGDALKIEIVDVQINRAWSVWLPEFGGLGAMTQDVEAIQTPVEGDRVRISEKLTVPLEPMIGCIAVAPAAGKGSTFMPAYPFGGNMDLREMSPGTTLWLPVQVAGGLLSLGDLHAAMGTAEPTWVSLEASGAAKLRIELEKQTELTYPRLQNADGIICVGMADSLEDAHQIALNQAYDVLIETHSMSPMEAYAYASARVAMRLGGPASSMVLAVVPEPAN